MSKREQLSGIRNYTWELVCELREIKDVFKDILKQLKEILKEKGGNY